MKPRVNTSVNIKAKKQAVKGFDAEAYPMLKNILLRKPILCLSFIIYIYVYD